MRAKFFYIMDIQYFCTTLEKSPSQHLLVNRALRFCLLQQVFYFSKGVTFFTISAFSVRVYLVQSSLFISICSQVIAIFHNGLIQQTIVSITVASGNYGRARQPTDWQLYVVVWIKDYVPFFVSTCVPIFRLPKTSYTGFAINTYQYIAY